MNTTHDFYNNKLIFVRKIILLFCLVFIHINLAKAQKNKILSWGDQGNGTYRNPIINGDYSDPDVIRVNDDFYMVTSTFHMSPGVMILHSKDLVNWTIIGHAFSDLSQFNVAYGPDKMEHYSHGVWASAIRYHNKKFWVYVFDPSFGLYMTSASNITGPWEPAIRVMEGEYYCDPCPFWDDDGQMYVTGARYPPWVNDSPRTYDLFLWKLSSDGKKLLDSGTVIHRGIGSEGTKILKIKDWYYIFYVENQDADFKNDRLQMVMRSKNLYGPYEHHRMLQQRKIEERSPCQGGLVDTKDGSWWFLHQQGESDYIGRQLVLEPVTWVDGWPIVGKVLPDGIGSMVWEHIKPIQQHKIVRPQSSDYFDSNKLQPQWEWNHAPRNDKWSVKARKGYLRLQASVPCFKGFWGASNTLSQRMMGYGPGTITTLIDIEGMADGQEAGLCVIANEGWMLQVYQQNSKRNIRVKSSNDKYCVESTPEITNSKIWLRALSQKNVFRFQYSLNGKDFINIGEEFSTYFMNWRGVRLGLFSFNETKSEGFIDVDWFTYAYE